MVTCPEFSWFALLLKGKTQRFLLCHAEQTKDKTKKSDSSCFLRRRPGARLSLGANTLRLCGSSGAIKGLNFEPVFCPDDQSWSLCDMTLKIDTQVFSLHCLSSCLSALPPFFLSCLLAGHFPPSDVCFVIRMHFFQNQPPFVNFIRPFSVEHRGTLSSECDPLASS